MSQVIEISQVELVPLDLKNLQGLASGEPTDFQAQDGALPPAHVAARALAQLEAGAQPSWCVPMLIIESSSGEILGGCTFKGEPKNGRVEIGYGIAGSARCRGVATAAVSKLVALAASSGSVREVYAHILPDNIASNKVVSRVGFSSMGMTTDSDGEQVVHWTYRVAT